MVRGVNESTEARRAERVASTEQRLVAVATRLFLRSGYAGTTLTTVAEEAGLAPRTVYLRFGTKAALFRRVMDVAVVGDTAQIDVAHRDWTRRSLTADALDDRIRIAVGGIRDIMARIGPLLPVAEQAAAVEPEVARAAQAAREDTRDQIRRFWNRAAADGLLPAGTDVDWLADTAAVLAAADTFLHISRTHGWTPDDYEHWLQLSWRRLLAAATSPPA
jgi:AcrR family transcriptional regulator